MLDQRDKFIIISLFFCFNLNSGPFSCSLMLYQIALNFVFSTFCVYTQNINKLYNECTKQDCLIIKTFVKMPDQFA